MSIGPGGQSATCVTPQNMPSSRREPVCQQMCILASLGVFENEFLKPIFAIQVTVEVSMKEKTWNTLKERILTVNMMK